MPEATVPAVGELPAPGTGPATADGPVEGPVESRLAGNLRRFAGNRFAVGGLVFLVLIILFSFAGPLVYHTNQSATNLILENQRPSAAHLLGTNPEGFDVLGRLMVGGQSTLEVAFAVAVISTAFGTIWGAIAGYVGGLLDAFLMRVVDTMLSIPFLFFVVLLAALVQPTLLLIIVVISAVSWLSTARLVRAEILSLRTRDYAIAAKGFGGGHWRVILRHLVPNALGVVVVNGTLKVADAILIFASISYLGLGVPPPSTSWGRMLTTGVNNLFDGYWWQLWPAALAIVLTVIAINAVGDGLRDMVEKRLESRSNRRSRRPGPALPQGGPT